MKEYKVKGTIILDYIRMIRANPDKNWDKYLEKEDWDIINGRVLPSVWYPYDIFYRCGKAVFFEIAQESMELTRAFGKTNADTLFEGTYKGIMDSVQSSGGGVVKILERYVTLTPNLINFAKLSLEIVNERNLIGLATVEIDPKDMLAEPYFNQLAGTIERLIEMGGGKNIKISFIRKIWEGDPDMALDIKWDE